MMKLHVLYGSGKKNITLHKGVITTSYLVYSLHCCLQFHMNLSTWTFLWDEMNIHSLNFS